jgi:hypothetical protein
MISAFPSDLNAPPIATREIAAPTDTYPAVGSGSLNQFLRRTEGREVHFTGATLRYPASLSTSGMNPRIVEFRRSTQAEPAAGAAPEPASQNLNMQSADLLRPSPFSEAPPSSSRKPSSARPSTTRRQLVVPILGAWTADHSVVFNKPVIDRGAFDSRKIWCQRRHQKMYAEPFS